MLLKPVASTNQLEEEASIDVDIELFESKYNPRRKYEKYIRLGHIGIAIFMIAILVFLMTLYVLYEINKNMPFKLGRTNNLDKEKSVSFEQDTWPWYRKAAHEYSQFKKHVKRRYRLYRRRASEIWTFLLEIDEEEAVDPSQPSTSTGHRHTIEETYF